MIRSICTVAVALCALPQDEAEPLSLEQELAHLIEKTNALESFHLIYDVDHERDGKSEAMALEVIYRAPDLGRIRWSMPEGDVDMWVVGNHMYYFTDDRWQCGVLPDPPAAHELLDQLFPRDAQVLEPGVSFAMTVIKDPDPDKHQFQMSFNGAPCCRPFVVSWLANMQRHLPDILLEDSTFIWSTDGCRFFVSRETGLMERIEGGTEGEVKLSLRLRESIIDEPLDPDLVTVPDEAKDKAIDPEMTRPLEQSLLPSFRHGGFSRVDAQLDSEKRAWNDATRSDWRSFLDALHREWIDKQFARWLEGVSHDIDKRANWVRTQLSEDDSDARRAELEEQMDLHRAGLDGRLGELLTQFLEFLTSTAPEVDRQELFDIELEVIDELWDELVVEPTLAAFDERIAAVLEE